MNNYFKKYFIFLASIFLLVIISACKNFTTPKKTPTIIGRVENVVLQDIGITLKARIDTGAGITSLNAKIKKIMTVANGKKEKIIFEIRDELGVIKTLEREIIEWVEIKGKGLNKIIRRPVVRLDLCFGGRWLEGRVNLADRSSFIYPILIGRNLLKTGDFLIDPRKKFMKHPGCKR